MAKGFPYSLKEFRKTFSGNNPATPQVDIGAAPAIAGLTANEVGVGAYRTTTLTLVDVVVSIVSVTSGNGVGGTKVYDFPEGKIQNLGTVASLSTRVATAKQADYTDATPEGDLGIGTVAPLDADALGTDAADDDWATATPFTQAAYASTAVKLPNEAAATYDGSTTPIDLYVNALVDAADIDDGVTTQLLVSGTISVNWLYLGDTA